MKKRILSFVLVISILSSLIIIIPIDGHAASEGSCGDNLTWFLDDQGTLTISGTGEMYDYSAIMGRWTWKNAKKVIINEGVASIGNRAFMDCYKIVDIQIPDSVVKVGESAFVWCDNLENIKFSSNVTEIENGVFQLCEKIKSINFLPNVIKIGDVAFGATGLEGILIIPDSVEEIGSSAFGGCENLTEIYINKNVSKIGFCAFAGCSNVEKIYWNAQCDDFDYESSSISRNFDGIGSAKGGVNLVFGDNVKRIPAFICYNWDNGYGDTTVKSISIPKCVTEIGCNAFYGCSSLTDIYYEGSEEEWNNINVETGALRINPYASNIPTIHYNSSMPDYTSNYKEPSQKSGTFKFASSYGNGEAEDGNSIGSFDYDDNYFANSAYTYNHSLAKMSLNLAMSAFANHKLSQTNVPSGVTGEYSQQYKNAYALLEEVGFENIFYNDCYIEKPKTNSIGVISGSKKIAYADDDYTLIAVGIRGNGYEAEWGGNFNVGGGKTHLGFSLARNQVLQHIKDYIDNNNINGKIKLWITGFSRAAATTNLTAAYIDEHLDMFGNAVSLEAKDLYAYCFETPAGTAESNRNQSLYGNIFSIVNTNDFVPMVVMDKWGFGRYGVIKYIPSELTMHTEKYNELFEKMETNYKNLTKQKYNDYLIDDFVSGMHGNNMGLFLEDVIDDLADAMVNEAEYSIYFEDAIMTLAGDALGGDAEIVDKLLKKILNKIEENRSKLIVASAMTEIAMGPVVGTSAVLASDYIILRMIIKEALQEMNINFFDDTKIDRITLLLARLWLNGTIDILKENLETLGSLGFLAQAHYPELCLAWLEAMEEDDFRDKNLRTFYINCPVDLEVYDSNNTLVAAIYNNVPQKIEGSSIVAYVDANGQKVVYLPTDEEYRTEIIATDDGEVTYSVQEQNADTGATRVINYNNMTVKKDDTMTGIVENLSEIEVATYALTSNSVRVEEPEVIENAMPVAITPVAEGNGNVSGGGHLYNGEFAQVTATALKDETFLGWYNGEILVSTDATYRFQVAEELTLTAKFTENTCEILYLTDDENVVVIDRILKDSKSKFPEMTQNPNYMILGIYTDAEYTTLADEDTTYSEDTVLYAKVLTPDKWVQFDEDNNKVVVYSPVAISGVQLMMALYEEEKLTGLKPDTVDLVVGKNELENLITNTGTADTLKIFVWNGLSTLKPLFKNCVVDLK